jgi:hypothetical protein
MAGQRPNEPNLNLSLVHVRFDFFRIDGNMFRKVLWLSARDEDVIFKRIPIFSRGYSPGSQCQDHSGTQGSGLVIFCHASYPR